jgi:hypothetical protein
MSDNDAITPWRKGDPAKGSVWLREGCQGAKRIKARDGDRRARDNGLGRIPHDAAQRRRWRLARRSCHGQKTDEAHQQSYRSRVAPSTRQAAGAGSLHDWKGRHYGTRGHRRILARDSL